VKLVKILGALAATAMLSTSVQAETNCRELLKQVGGYEGFSEAVNIANDETSNFGFTALAAGMWASLVDTSGKVCAVYSVNNDNTANGGANAGNKAWLGSRVISAQKASTANAFSLDDLSIPTGALAAAVYPGGSLYGLQHSNPVDPKVAYAGSVKRFGTKRDPLRNKRIGGINVFGGGIALYAEDSIKMGAVGVSGDTSCRDHAMSYRVRFGLGLDSVPNADAVALVPEPADLFEMPQCGLADPDDEINLGTFIFP